MDSNDCSPHRVLIVEDEPNIREALRLTLDIEGYHVQTSVNGQEGLETLAKIPRPCLILLDLMMPVLDGWEFARALRADHRWTTIPVVVVTAYADRLNTIDVQGLLKKPINLETLLKTVEKYCEKHCDGHAE